MNDEKALNEVVRQGAEISPGNLWFFSWWAKSSSGRPAYWARFKL